MTAEKTIWTFWQDGRDNAPLSVESSLKSWERRNPGWQLRCLDVQSAARYVPVDSHVDLDRRSTGSFSSLLRLLLLREFGGVWADATLSCDRPLDDWLPAATAEGFFAFAAPSADRPLSSAFLSGVSDNYLVSHWCGRAIADWRNRPDRDDESWLDSLFGTLCATDPRAAEIWAGIAKADASVPGGQFRGYMSRPRADDSKLETGLVNDPVRRPMDHCPVPPARPLSFASLKVSTQNLGDHIQIIAGLRLLSRLGIVPTRYIDRDNEIRSAPMLDDEDRPVAILLNGWFKQNRAEWPPHPKLVPLILGFHIRLFQCPELISKASIDFFRRHQPIGCRDVYTEKLLRAEGVEVFLSHCLTLALPRRTDDPATQTDVFVVSRDERLNACLPGSIGPVTYLSHYTDSDDFSANMARAEALLEVYRSRAKLIVTTFLHCALPAIAMGIPVVVFYPLNHAAGQASDRERFSSLETLIRVYRFDEAKEVDWNPKPVDIGGIKLRLLDRFYEMAARLGAAPSERPPADTVNDGDMGLDRSFSDPIDRTEPAGKRAIVWLCWGKAFVAQAIESARSAARVDADRILLTDMHGAEQARASGAFTSVVVVRLLHLNYLEKSRLIDLLPAGYESFLYLDTDTTIIGDLTLGFQMAERHGVAVAPAANYNLSEYFNFGPIMTRAGLLSADQMQYNAGVIFFRLTPTVRRLLTRWRDLCQTLGAEQGFMHDQPVLTMVFEEMGFLPYVLSPLYNYRSMGELAVGKIRIWHSHYPLPAGFNDFDLTWPARRFIDGVRDDGDAPAKAAQAEPAASRSMFRQRLSTSRHISGSARTLTVANTALAIKKEQSSREAIQYLIGFLGIETSDDLNESYFAEALSYHLGLLFAHAPDPERMAEHISLSHTMPGHDDDLLFSDHVDASRALNAHRRKAIRRGMPSLFFSCMPRSASATLTHILGQVFDIPVLHLSVGRFPDLYIAPSWLDMFLEGGAITQDHFGPNDFNIGVLTARGPRDVFVLIRDPRAAARSQVHHLSRQEDDAHRSLEAAIESECIVRFIPWLQAWIDRARQPDETIRVHWLTYNEVRGDPAALLRKIVHILLEAHPQLSPYADCENVPNLKLHYVSGDDDAWRLEVGEDARSRMWAACTPDIRALLALTP